MKLYLAGPMTGAPDFNYPAFNEAAVQLRAQDFEVVNPAENFDGDQSLGWSTYLRLAVRQVTECDAVALLPGWEGSRGARLELSIAISLGLGLYRYRAESLWPYDHELRIDEEAFALVMGDRQAAYGHPASDFTAMGRITAATLDRWLESRGLRLHDTFGTVVPFPDIEPRIVALIQQAVKLSREAAQPKRDNRVDGIGYWLCADRIVEGW